MKRVIAAWAAVFAGVGLMLAAYSAMKRSAAAVPFANDLMYLGEGEPVKTAGLPPYIEVRVRVVGPAPQLAALLRRTSSAGVTSRQRPVWGEKLVELPQFEQRMSGASLARGRLPRTGADEVLAGERLADRSEIDVPGRRLRVTGVLRPEVGVFGRCFILPADRNNDPLFAGDDRSVWDGYVLHLGMGLPEHSVSSALDAAFPSNTFAAVPQWRRVNRGLYYLYLTGMAVLLAGGSWLLIRLYGALARRSIPIVGQPLGELARRPQLLWIIHWVYFGSVLLSMAVVYEFPVLQTVLVQQAAEELGGGSGRHGSGGAPSRSGPLAVAGKAYASRNVPAAAAVTVTVNFFLGSLLVITVPSLVVPGVGALVALLRSVTWGLLLAPSSLPLALTMLPHSGTLLLEGEGYILATFFATLVPIYLFDGRVAPKIGGRFGRALVVNGTGSLVVLVVLLTAAVYEAIEVIAMMR